MGDPNGVSVVKSDFLHFSLAEIDIIDNNNRVIGDYSELGAGSCKETKSNQGSMPVFALC